MGFINNTSYILNAVLTKKGREYLAKNDARFSITKFALDLSKRFPDSFPHFPSLS